MSNEARSKRNNIVCYKRQLDSHLKNIEKANGAALALMNKMLCDSDFNDIQEDVVFALNNDFCGGEHLLTGLIEVMERMCERKPKVA